MKMTDIVTKIYYLIRYSHFGYLIKINTIIFGFLLIACILAYLNNDVAKFI